MDSSLSGPQPSALSHRTCIYPLSAPMFVHPATFLLHFTHFVHTSVTFGPIAYLGPTCLSGTYLRVLTLLAARICW